MSIKQRRQNRFSIFHITIIAILLFAVAGCGYKTDPVYTPSPDQNQTKVNS